MPRPPKPWYWKARKGWYVYIGKEKTPLGPDKDEAIRRFHEIMGKPKEVRQPAPEGSIAVILDDFLAWTYENRSKDTADRYKDFLQSFAAKHGRMRVSDLHSGHVTAWLNENSVDAVTKIKQEDGKPRRRGWSATTKKNAITALQRAFNWAVKNRGLDRNPIRGIEKPEGKRRTTVVSQDDFDSLMLHVTDEPFRDLLTVSYDIGCRPQEIKRLEARHLQLDKHRFVLPSDEAKKGIPRAAYIPTERSMEIIRRLAQKHPTGPIFRNSNGNPWTPYAVKLRFERLEKKVGKRFRHYDFRRTWITRKIIAGVDSHVVATLSGHKSTAMIDKHYSAVANNHEFLLEQARKGECNAASVSSGVASAPADPADTTQDKPAGHPRKS